MIQWPFYLVYRINTLQSRSCFLTMFSVKQYFAMGTRQNFTYSEIRCEITLMYLITHLGRFSSGTASCFRKIFPSTSTNWAALKWRMQTTGCLMFFVFSPQYCSHFILLVSSTLPLGTVLRDFTPLESLMQQWDGMAGSEKGIHVGMIFKQELHYLTSLIPTELWQQYLYMKT